MLVGIKNVSKLIGISIIACCAVLVCTMFLNFYFDVRLIESEITSELSMFFYNAQVSTAKVVCLVSGGYGRKETLQIAPTILNETDLDAPVMQEEIFGPILPVIGFETIEEAVNLVKQKEKPLALYLFTKEQAVKKQVLSQLSFGGGCINDTIVHLATPYMGFGGVGASGMGSYHGKAGFDTFSHKKSLLVRKSKIDIPIRYLPYRKYKNLFLHLFFLHLLLLYM